MSEASTPADAGSDDSGTEELSIDDEPLVRLAESPTAIRALSVFDRLPRAELTVAGVADLGEFSPKSWYNVEDRLLELGFIERAGKVGNAQTFRARRETPQFEAFSRFRGSLWERERE